MSIKDCTPNELTREQIQEVINIAMHKTYDEIDKLTNMDEEEVEEQATYQMAYQSIVYHLMLDLTEIVQEFKQMALVNQLESIKRMTQVDVDLEDREQLHELQPEEIEKITESMEDVLAADHKYTTLNNEVLMVLLFEVAKDVLTEEEFLKALLV